MLGFHSFELICQEYFSKELNLNDLSILSDLLTKIEINCIFHKDLEKFIILAIIIKGRWIYFSLQIITEAIDRPNQTFENQSLINKVARIIKSDISLLLKYLKLIINNEFNLKKYESIVNILSKQLKIINLVITKGGFLHWTSYLERLHAALGSYNVVLDELKPPRLQQLILGDILNTDGKNAYFSFFRKLKLEITLQAESNIITPSSLKVVKDRYQLIKKDDTGVVNDAIVRDIQDGFVNYLEFKNLINKIETVNTTHSRSSDKSITLENSDLVIPVCSTPVEDKRLHPPSFTCSVITSNIIINNNNKPRVPSKRQVSKSPEDIARWNKPKRKIQPTNNGDSFNESIITSMSSGRSQWNFHETHLIYKGVREGLTWVQIKNKYFTNTFRTNVSIKDRWRTMQSKPEIMETLKQMYKEQK